MTNPKMSDNSDSGSEDNFYNGKSNGKDYDICRDFLRNVCKRGRRCKYRHPSSNESRDSSGQKIVFCHDYQNTGCHRPNCKFLHCTREEEESYYSTRVLPPRLQQAVAMGYGGGETTKFDIPICKDFQKGQCVRGLKCKYRHVKSEFTTNGISERESRFDERFEEERYEGFDRYEYPAAKRRRVDLVSYPGFEERYRPMSYHIVEEENLMLRRKVEELKKTIADLTATNEVLLEQNARYRVSKANAVQTLTSGDLTHSVTQTLTPTVNPGGQATAHSIGHLNPTISQQISMNSDLATQHALQTAQRMASGAGLNVTPTINASMVPVSMTQTMVPVSLGQSNISMQTLHTGCTLTRSIPQSFAAQQSNPLVSYPIMSHSMRTAAGAPSSLAH
ncbi:zinc finger CCCH domain-containing protein 10 [Patella vulgata]|uniref:C3H1-type domain-containing protein n=1 Tax=Patella caerulea TaxID=87958 RepID=A0AAN8GB49_PATCE|nr:zinc finger CCCH domain-containing protein 10 [Patella vulgata]XP_050419382.1 zinc finger CCCH domain-containing protein 10 [Patella vulgata]XP_050419383.1 zinc finger CCCH domain-containing protein 10 [Patella vulgata]XP_050419384.1 zinc finger CCCH domain-containing protein 10 [Patella vulgata]XP_050419386.1 zinc finger CCCH domain-containing protein 10 [Patella vulgata]XP_050419387.1 zinc finger CCCH domain-containing protein 10 [Patella vulgata]XP_050419388.1 zinc finger CCCH domain-co